MRSLWLTLSFAVSAFFFAAGATAQDGLQRFEKEIKPQMELKSFTYGSASAIGSSGFVLNNVVAVMPGSGATGGKDTTVKIEKVTADEVDFDRMKAGGSDDIPRFMKIKLEASRPTTRCSPWRRPTACRRCRWISPSTTGSTGRARC